MKLFKASVEIESEVELTIQAEDNEAARKKAKELALKEFPSSSRVSHVELTLTNEVDFQVGSRVRHKNFGLGVIKQLKSTTNENRDAGWRATIEFDSEGTKEIVLMPGKQLLELIEA